MGSSVGREVRVITANLNGYLKRKGAVAQLIMEKVEIIGIQESHSTWAGSMKFGGYKVFESNSISETRRGVALLIRDGIFDSIKIAARHRGSEIFVTAKLDKVDFLIGSVHVHIEDRDKELLQLAAFLNERRETYKIVVGDFNTDLEEEEEKTIMDGGLLPCGKGKISQFLLDTGMVCGKFFELPWTKDSKTYDYIMVSAGLAQRLNFTQVRLDISSSDHHPVQSMLTLDNVNGYVNKYLEAKKLVAAKEDILKALPVFRDVARDWKENVEMAVEMVVGETLVTSRLIFEPKVRQNGFWFTGEMEEKLLEIHKLKIACRGGGNMEFKKLLNVRQVELEDLWRQELDEKARDMYECLEMDRVVCPSDFWKNMNRMSGKQGSRQQVTRIVNAEGEVLYGSEAMEAVEDRLVFLIKENPEWHVQWVLDRIERSTVHFGGLLSDMEKSILWGDALKMFDVEEIHRGIAGAKNNKAPGLDGWRSELLKIVDNDEIICKGIASTFDDVISGGHVPVDWQRARIVPIPKSGNPEDVKNWRGITLLCVVYKIFAALLARRIVAVLQRNEMMASEQFGFTQGKSTVDAAGLLVEILQRRWNGKCCHCFFLDISKAYDSVHPAALRYALTTFKMPERLISVILKLYASYEVTTKNETRERITWKTANCGVRQGCTLAPLLFIMLINGLIESVAALGGIQHPVGIKVPGYKQYAVKRGGHRKRFSQIWYADDAVMFAESQSELIMMAQHTNDYLEWMGMRMNQDKSKQMRFGGCRAGDCQSEMRINQKLIEEVQKFVYLGLEVSRVHLIPRMAGHRVKATKAALRNLGIWFQKNSKISAGARLMYLNAQITSVALYGVIVWAQHKGALQEIVRLTSEWTRRICGFHACSSSGLTLLESHGTIASIEGRRRQMKWIYNTIHDENRIREQVWLHELIVNRRGNVDTWINEAIEWGREELGIDILTIGGAQLIDEKVEEYVVKTWSKSCGSERNVQRYMTLYYKDMLWQSKQLMKLQKYEVGRQTLMQFRIGDFWSSKMIRLTEGGKELSDADTLRECLFCRMGDETIRHCLIECREWQRSRDVWFEKFTRCEPKFGKMLDEEKEMMILKGTHMDASMGYLQELMKERVVARANLVLIQGS